MIKTSATVSFALALLLSIAAYYFTEYWRDLLMMLGGTCLSLSIGLLVVNLFINAEERKKAAAPLLKMIAPDIERLHNDLFIRPGHAAFGSEAFGKLQETYQRNNGSPVAFSPEDRKKLYDMIVGHKNDILTVHSALADKFKELATLIGWSYDPAIVRALLSCRLSMQAFQNVNFDDSSQAQLDACEHFMDAENSSVAVAHRLAETLGMQL